MSMFFFPFSSTQTSICYSQQLANSNISGILQLMKVMKQEIGPRKSVYELQSVPSIRIMIT